LAEHTGNILLRLDVAASEMRTIDRQRTVALVSTPFAAATAEVAELLARARGGDGGATAHLSTAPVADVVARVARGECSAGVVEGIVGPADPLAAADPGLLTSLLLRVAPLSVMLPADHPFASRQSISWASVSDARWLDVPGLVPHMAPGAAQLLERRSATTRYTGTDPSVLGPLVAGRHGLALVPSWWSPSSTDVRVVPLSRPALEHRIEVLVLRSNADEWSELVTTARTG
jgi:hypothetical protein